jgi:hypothetical protein
MFHEEIKAACLSKKVNRGTQGALSAMRYSQMPLSAENHNS